MKWNIRKRANRGVGRRKTVKGKKQNWGNWGEKLNYQHGILLLRKPKISLARTANILAWLKIPNWSLSWHDPVHKKRVSSVWSVNHEHIQVNHSQRWEIQFKLQVTCFKTSRCFVLWVYEDTGFRKYWVIPSSWNLESALFHYLMRERLGVANCWFALDGFFVSM